MPKRPPRLDFIFQSYDPPLFFVTFNTYRRRRILSTSPVNKALAEFGEAGEKDGVALGRFVIMPDHIYLFVQGGPDFVLTQWVRMLKRTISKAIPSERPHWQSGFFDHLIRHSESYAQKWDYVRQNPVRAGLVSMPEEWPWQGEIVTIEGL